MEGPATAWRSESGRWGTWRGNYCSRYLHCSAKWAGTRKNASTAGNDEHAYSNVIVRFGDGLPNRNGYRQLLRHSIMSQDAATEPDIHEPTRSPFPDPRCAKHAGYPPPCHRQGGNQGDSASGQGGGQKRRGAAPHPHVQYVRPPAA